MARNIPKPTFTEFGQHQTTSSQAVDTLRFIFFTHCTKANHSDADGLLEILSHNMDYLQAKPINIPKSASC